jgi:hypothetical protein
MKWIKTRKQWLNEAKIRDVIFPRQAKELSERWGEKFLDYEEIQPTDKIIQGKWKVDDEDRIKVLSAFFDCDMGDIMQFFSSLPDKLSSVITESIDTKLLSDESATVMTDFNIQSPTVDQIVFLYEPVFRKLDINQTRATDMIQKDENGRPVRDEGGNMIRIKKNEGDPIFTNNLVNINTFMDDYNRCYVDEKVETSGFQKRGISQLRNLAKENHNRDYKYEYNIFGKDLYLEINHNPKDILNMSISKFYASCQHLYSGGYREQLLGNVFDPNSVPAFLVFDTPIIWNGEKISDKLPLSRMMIRNIESFDDKEEKTIFFDRAYPDRMKEGSYGDVFGEIVEKYSGNKNTKSDRSSFRYLFTPDIGDDDDQIRDPYMDRLRMQRGRFIGVNTKTLYLNRMHDWSSVKISPKAKIKEVIIETTDIPENFLDIPMELEWVKFKFLKISTLSGFEKVKTNKIAFDKCKFGSNILEDINQINPEIEKLQIISCDLVGDLTFSQLKNLKELHLVYTLDSLSDMKESLLNLNLDKLVISGDLVTDKESKEFISYIRSKGTKVEIVGPKI